jgi:signal transduction histidine kinase
LKYNFKKNQKKLNNINVILWRYFALFALVLIVIVGIVCYGVLGSAFSSQARDRVKSIGEDLTQYIDQPRVTTSELYDKMWHYQLSDGVDVFLINYDGDVILPTNAATSDSWTEIVENMKSSLGDWARDKAVVYSTSDTLNFASCVVFGNGRNYLLVRYPLSITNSAVHTMQLYIIIIAVVAIIIAFLVSYTVSQKLSRPIKNISSTATRMAKGDYSVQFTSMEYQEIAQLSDTLNYLKDEIKKSDDFQKELLANVSHDFKTPLTMIKAYASMVKEISGNDPEKRDKHLQVIIDESDRLTGLVNDVLSASKISAGLEQLNKKVFNLTEYLYSIINKFDYLQETQGYKIIVDIDPNLYTLADEEKIGQVIYNLLSNAINYTGEDKKIYISLKDSPQDNRIKFSVRDTGKGISEDELKNIWDRYYRSTDAHLRPVKGTGLGLNIVKVILQSHAFDFGVNSKLDEGSTFYVDFPAVSSKPDDNTNT